MRAIKPLIAIAALALAVWQVRLLLAVLAGGAGNVAVETAQVRKGEFAAGISREGTLQSANVAYLRAPESGSTITWIIEDAAQVKKGDLIAKVDVSEYKFRVDQQRLEYQNALSRVDQERRRRTREYESAEMSVDKTVRGLEVLSRSQFVEKEQGQAQVGFDTWNLTWAETDYEKHQRLGQDGIVPRTTVEQAERVKRSHEHALDRSQKSVSHLDATHASKRAQTAADLDSAKFGAELAKRRIGEAIESAQESAKRVKQWLTDMEEQLAGGEARASAAGTVVLGDTWDETGQHTIRQGDRVWGGMELASITDLSELEVSLRVEETAAHRIKVNQEALLTVVGLPHREFRGKVTSIGAVARIVMPWEDPNARPDQRVFDITVRVLSPDPKLVRPGMKAKVQFVFEKVPDAIYVPLEAVYSRKGGEVVYVSKGGGFVPRRVKTGKRNDEAVVVTEGLKPGERVALTDPTRAEQA